MMMATYPPEALEELAAMFRAIAAAASDPVIRHELLEKASELGATADPQRRQPSVKH